MYFRVIIELLTSLVFLMLRNPTFFIPLYRSDIHPPKLFQVPRIPQHSNPTACSPVQSGTQRLRFGTFSQPSLDPINSVAGIGSVNNHSGSLSYSYQPQSSHSAILYSMCQILGLEQEKKMNQILIPSNTRAHTFYPLSFEVNLPNSSYLFLPISIGYPLVENVSSLISIFKSFLLFHNYSLWVTQR